MMAEFMHIDPAKPTIAMAAAQTVKAEENYKKATEDEELTEVLEDLETEVYMLKAQKMVEKLREELEKKKRG
ncbi:Hypp9056 [Branchiostoma lanceolatum]|uniref:Hypp9056 protein n=1 Tax=Branchiostoma lanceolatum TaxID=7740 RepID=A0A8J9ZCG5_BRALA|nr:Hypp9056 [Branchiostoma lanceolatum]